MIRRTIILSLVLILLVIKSINMHDQFINQLIQVESRGDTAAISNANCRGLMQISSLVLEEYNKVNHTSYIIDDLHEPEINVRIGKWYLNRLQYHYIPADKYSIEVLLGAYNWGIGNVRRVNYDYDRFPKSVQQYIMKVLKGGLNDL